MAEFFSECIKKIKTRLVVTKDIVSQVENSLKSTNITLFKSLLENTIDSHHVWEFYTETLQDTLQVFEYYYRCTSLKNAGIVHLRGNTPSLTDSGKLFPAKMI